MNRLILLLIALVLSCEAMRALELQFNNVGEPISKKDSLTIVRVIGHQLEFYGKFKELGVVRFKLRVFSHPAEMLEYFREQNLSVDHYVAGLYSGRLQEAIVMRKEGYDYTRVVFHEFTHHLTFLCLRNSPGWLSEGLSEYFEQVEIRGKRIVHLLKDYSIGQIKTAYQLDEINLRNVVAWSKKSFYKNSFTNQALPYTLSHCLVYFLIEQKPEFFDLIFKALQQGETSAAAIETHYPNGFSGFEKDFYQYIMR